MKAYTSLQATITFLLVISVPRLLIPCCMHVFLFILVVRKHLSLFQIYLFIMFFIFLFFFKIYYQINAYIVVICLVV